MVKQSQPRKMMYSIQTTVVLAFSLLILAIIVTALTMSYRFTITEVRYVSTDYISQLISQVNNDINQYVGNMEDVADFVGKNPNVHDWMENASEMDGEERDALEQIVREQMSIAAEARTDISNIAIFDKAGNAIFDNSQKRLNSFANHQSVGWYAEAAEARGAAVISSSHVQNVVAGQYPWVVSLSKAIVSKEGDVLGVLLVDLNYRRINDLCESIDMGNRGYIFVVDKEGNIIFHPQQQLIYSRLQTENIPPLGGMNAEMTLDSPDGVKIYISDHSEVTGWTVVGVAYQDEILRNQSNIIGFYISIGTVFLMVAVVMSAAISSAITGPIKKLKAVMQNVEQGRLDMRSESSSRNEIGQLSAAFNTMITRVNLLMSQRDREQEQRRQSEFKALQAQINPHFLYNTLDSIIWMAENGNTEEVVEMTAALARLFRSSISESRDTVPLSVEIANIKSYLTIQQMRYQEKLAYHIEIPRELENATVPKLTLQPLVENAIYHGIKGKDGGGEITVTGGVEDGCMVLRVRDNGAGMTKEQLDGILSEHSDGDGHGIGVRNVNDRIKMIFGARYGLRYSSETGEGTTVEVVLPTAEGGVTE